MTISEVNAVAQAFHDGVAKRDAAALASLYTEDDKFLPPGMEPCEGKAQTQSAMQQLLDMGARSLDLEPLDVREADNLTIEYGRYRLGIDPTGSAPMTDVGKYVVVHERQADGSTKILYDIFNSNTPAARLRGRRQGRPAHRRGGPCGPGVLVQVANPSRAYSASISHPRAVA